MFFDIPEKIKRLQKIIEPYLDKHANLETNAPEDVKKAYAEFQRETGLLMNGVM
jgi:hypothetical protein